MPTATSTPKRAIVATILVAALVTGVAGIAATACGGPATTDAPNALVDLRPLGEALARGQEASYTAEYATGEGMSVTVVHAPPRRVYRSKVGVYVLSPDAAYLCKATACDRAPGADAMPMSHAVAVGAALEGGFVVPEYATAALGRAAARPGARVARAQRVVAGGPADCYTVSVDGAAWTACVGAAGVLAYFDGTHDEAATDDGAGSSRIELRTFTPTIAADAFQIPPASSVTDVTALR